MLLGSSIFRHPAYSFLFHDPDPPKAGDPPVDPTKVVDPPVDPPAPEFKAPTSQAEFEVMIKNRIAQAERAAERKFKESEPDLEKSIREKIAKETETAEQKEQGKFKELWEKSEAEKVALQKAIDDAKKTSTEAERAEMRKAAGKKYGLSEIIAGRLTGDDAAAIDADAQAVAKELNIEAPDTEAGKGGNQNRSKGGNPPARTHRFGSGIKVVPFPGNEQKKE